MAFLEAGPELDQPLLALLREKCLPYPTLLYSTHPTVAACLMYCPCQWLPCLLQNAACGFARRPLPLGFIPA